MTFNSQIFNRIHSGNLVYNTCWEDPRCDRALLGFDAKSSIVMLTSAGCNALDYLLDAPASIDCVDMNPRQNALLQLKKAFYVNSDHETLEAFFGQGRHARPDEVFQDALSQHLENYAANYWRRHIRYFAGKGLRKSFYFYGSSGLVAFLLRSILQVDPKTAKAVRAMFETDDLDRQRNLYYKVEPLLLNNITMWALNSHLIQSMLGVPASQQAMARSHYKDGMTGYFRDCLRKVFTALPLQDNYFWRLYFFGNYSAECVPNYLKKDYFETIKKQIDRVKTHTGTLSFFLQNNPGAYSHFVLLDHQDWLVANDPAALEEEWRLILDNSASGAKILFRSAAPNRAFIPSFVHDFGSFDDTMIPYCQSLDRVGTYSSTHLFVKR